MAPRRETVATFMRGGVRIISLMEYVFAIENKERSGRQAVFNPSFHFLSCVPLLDPPESISTACG
jgi:hypothetical protein